MFEFSPRNLRSIDACQAGPCCSLSGASSTSTSGGGVVDRQDRFLVSTRGSSASHAVFGLHAPLAFSAAAAAATGEHSTQSGGTEEGVVGAGGPPSRDERHHQARGSGAGAPEGGLKCDGQHQQRQAGQGASDAGAAATVADYQSWWKSWTRIPGVMKVRLDLCVLLVVSENTCVRCMPTEAVVRTRTFQQNSKTYFVCAEAGGLACTRIPRQRSNRSIKFSSFFRVGRPSRPLTT